MLKLRTAKKAVDQEKKATTKNPTKTQTKPNQNPNETQLKPNENLNKNKNKNINKNININKEYQQQQKEINKEKDFNVVDDVDVEKKQFAFDCCCEKLNKLYLDFDTDLDVGTFDRIKSLFLYIYEKDSFIISNEKIKSSDILLKLVQLFVGTNLNVVNRFDKIFVSIDNAENVNNKQNYSVSVLYQYACSN